MDETQADFAHTPVLVAEAVEWLRPALEPDGLLVDCTLGGGGHAEAFLEVLPDLEIIGIDRDDEALAVAARRLARFGKRFRRTKSNFAQIGEVVGRHGYEEVAAVLYDLGASTAQLRRPYRGFGYRGGFALDMRMDQSTASPDAADIVNNYSEARLADILFSYGEERFSRRIARAIVARRATRPFLDAGDLAEVVRGAIPAATRRTGPHPARRTFQALRIETNQELESLQRSLEQAVEVVRPGGRIAAISYHSLEDRIVKRTFRDFARGCICPPDLPHCACGREPQLALLTPRPVCPGPEEMEANPSSQSARMRVAEKRAAA